MDTWDEEKLRSVVLSKTGKPRTTTDVCSASSYAAALIFCRSSANILFKPLKRKSTSEDHIVVRHLLITHRFGWFWECPNGENCMYRHALPPGFVLKSQRKALEAAAKANTISIEEFLEVEVCFLNVGG